MTELSRRQLSRLLKRISLKDNDIILVRRSKFAEDDVMEMLKMGVEQLGFNYIFVIFVEDFDDIKVLNKQDMNARGWYHVDQINKVTGRIKNG